ncbi:MAG: hypothetical protein NWQ40_02645, partial [Schleiferiaceae bacterium]|nr:hypothetical protein [Schleiferiaceae bacterium]
MAQVRAWFVGLWLVALAASAQPVEQALVPWGGAATHTFQSFKTFSDTLNLPLSAGFDHRIPSGWTSRGVQVSQTMARKPLSLGVAVFDGISGSGAPYHPGVLSTDTLGDALYSP